MKNQTQLDALYSVYGFKKNNVRIDNISVFTYDIGYFHNADIIYESGFEDQAAEIKEDFERSGYSSKLKPFTSLQDVESSLFDGFFSIKDTKKKLLNNYGEYCDRHTLTSGTKYEYIPSAFYNTNLKQIENKNLAQQIVYSLGNNGPQLIIVEAAAGFGKTTTVNEVVNAIAQSSELRIPFLAELSKNRQAQIFKYVLLDEINRQFPTLNLEVISFHVRKGDVVLIVDGFDELLRKSEDAEDDELIESAEPMLETISYLLKGNAKVILTTRKTALFSGDGFHCWMEKHLHEFLVDRYSILEPNPEQWVGRDRKQKLLAAGFDLSIVPNPVLLSWLRGKSDSDFDCICGSTELLIDNYFGQLLEREKERQALYASPEEQQGVFKKLAEYFIKIESSSDTKEALEKVISSECKDFIRNLRNRYSSDERPTEEQVVEKLALHALLDRKQNGSVGFVNDFVFGYFIGEFLVENKTGEWVVDDERFAEYAISSFRNRSPKLKLLLWDVMSFYIDLMSPGNKYLSDMILTGRIKRDYISETFEEICFENVLFGYEQKTEASSFSNCTFIGCSFDFVRINDSCFVGCRFYSSTAINLGNDDLFFGCQFESSSGFEFSKNTSKVELVACSEWERHVLTKIWPPGAARLSTRRALTTIRMGVAQEFIPEIEEAIDSLKRKRVLSVFNETIVVNLSEIKTIKELLGRE